MFIYKRTSLGSYAINSGKEIAMVGIIIVLVTLFLFLVLVFYGSFGQKIEESRISRARKIAIDSWRVEIIATIDGYLFIRFRNVSNQTFVLRAGGKHPDIDKLRQLEIGNVVRFDFSEKYKHYGYLQIK